mmetsp:Transcript_48819/g.114650  ORF Transcript_48819/g.114650 Transcript_48819/m.114650 type:complete len:218 (-) Transcript_48819:469-1122(-)
MLRLYVVYLYVVCVYVVCLYCVSVRLTHVVASPPLALASRRRRTLSRRGRPRTRCVFCREGEVDVWDRTHGEAHGAVVVHVSLVVVARGPFGEVELETKDVLSLEPWVVCPDACRSASHRRRWPFVAGCRDRTFERLQGLGVALALLQVPLCVFVVPNGAALHLAIFLGRYKRRDDSRLQLELSVLFADRVEQILTVSLELGGNVPTLRLNLLYAGP